MNSCASEISCTYFQLDDKWAISHFLRLNWITMLYLWCYKAMERMPQPNIFNEAVYWTTIWNSIMKVSSFCFVVISVLLAYLVTTNEGFVSNDQNQLFIGDVNRCSNINPLVDSKTIDLIAYGKWSEGKFCTALRRDLKVADE